MPFDENGVLQFSDVDFVDTWKAMEKLLDTGKVRSLGVSNFSSEQIERVLAECKVKPVTNQVECSPRINQKKLVEFCKARDITVTAHSPLGRPHLFEKDPENKPKPVLDDQKVIEMGTKYGKTPVQIVLRYLVECGVIPVPKSTSVDHLKQNLDIFNFELSSEDTEVLDGFNTNQRMVGFSRLVGHQYYPFNIEF